MNTEMVQVIGHNRMYLDGKIFLGPQFRLPVGTAVLIIVPSLVFDCATLPVSGVRVPHISLSTWHSLSLSVCS